jgi:hypothetical protein
MDASKYEVFARCLRAAAGAPCLEQEGLLYLVYDEDEELIEQLVKGPELINQDVITSAVKEDAPAAYVYLNDQSVRLNHVSLLQFTLARLTCCSALHSPSTAETSWSFSHSTAAGLNKVLAHCQGSRCSPRAGCRLV